MTDDFTREYGARIRAAQGYIGQDREEFAKAVGIQLRTYDRVRAGVRGPALDEMRRISKHTGVPLLFLTYGWQFYEALERLQAQPGAEETFSFLEALLRAAQRDRHTPPDAQDQDDEDHQAGRG